MTTDSLNKHYSSHGKNAVYETEHTMNHKLIQSTFHMSHTQYKVPKTSTT